MQTCEGEHGQRHDEIVYEGSSDCPVCEAIIKLDNAGDEMKKVRTHMVELMKVIEDHINGTMERLFATGMSDEQKAAADFTPMVSANTLRGWLRTLGGIHYDLEIDTD